MNVTISKLCGHYFPFDSNEVSQKVADKQGISQAEVLDQWKAKAEQGSKFHKILEVYTKQILAGNEVELPELAPNEAKKLAPLVDDLLSDGYEIVGAEVNLSTDMLRGKLDAVFKKGDHHLVVDWKSKTGMFERERCKEPLTGFYNDKHSQYLFQVMSQGYLYTKVNKLEESSVVACYAVPSEEGDKSYKLYTTGLDNELIDKALNFYFS